MFLLFGGVFGWIAAVLHTFHDKCSLFQSKYAGCNFGSTAPRKQIGFGEETVDLSLR